MSRCWYGTDLTGGSVGCLDYIDGALLSENDGAVVNTGTYVYFYILDISSSPASESSPSIIAPDSNPGNKRWLIVGMYTGSASLSGFANRTVNNVTDLSLTLTSDYHNEIIDCYNASDQTLTIDTLTSAHDGVEFRITKMGAGDVIINAPSGITFDGTDNQITISSLGYELKLRYNHTRSMLVITYSGNITGTTV